MAWSLDTEKVDLGFTNPPVGKNRYKITEMKLEQNKKDLSGKSQFISMKIKESKMVYSVPFFVMAEDETQAKIANQNIAKIGVAVGITGVIKSERLKSFVGKECEMDFQPSKKDAKYVNFQSAYPIKKEEDPEPEPETTDEEEQQEEEETPKPAGDKKFKWQQ